MEKKLKDYLETIIRNQLIIQSKLDKLSGCLIESDRKIAESTEIALNNLLKTSAPKFFEADKKSSLKKKISKKNVTSAEKHISDYRR